MKKCSTCKLEKPYAEFSKSTARGYQTYCKSCAALRRAQWARDNTDKTREYRIKNRYGLTTEQFTAMMLAQGSKCAICETDLTVPVIDHNHDTGEVRGILCVGCNTKLAAYEDKVAMEASMAYLAKYAPIV